MKNPEHATAADVQRALGTATPRRSVWRSRWRWIVLALLAALIAYWFLARNAAEKVTYSTEPVTRGDLTVTVTATGTLQPTNQVDIGSELSGTVREVFADYNDLVKKDAVLARLDTTRLDAQVLQAENALASAEANIVQSEADVREAKANLARLYKVRELSGNKIPSQQDLDVAEASAARADAQLRASKASAAQAKATLNAVQTDLSKAAIRSPINGVVLVRSVEPGQTVAASLQAPVLFTLAEDLKRMELHVDVDEADVGKVHEDQPATFTVDAYPDRVFRARIKEVRYAAAAAKSTGTGTSSSGSTATTTGVVTYETVLEVDNSDLLLRPRMTATAAIRVQQVKDAMLIPNAALRFSPPSDDKQQSGPGANNNRSGIMGALMPRMRMRGQGGNAGGAKRETRVWTLKDGKPQPITLRIGASDGRNTQVLDSTLQPGTELLVDAEKPANAR
ncbi:MAG: efflux RND transporter periplasmic adaptor subunit [Steroidobacteraceae bacterium]